MAIITLPLEEKQIVDLVHQLSPDGKRAVLRVLLRDIESFEDLLEYGHARIEAVAQARNVQWHNLTEAEREQFIDQLLHES